MQKSTFMEKLDLKRLQVIENHYQGNEFYISPNLTIEKVVSCNSTQNKTNQGVELNFDDLSTSSLFLNFINEKSVISNQTIALITGLPGIGKSQMLIEIENLFWKQFNINSNYQILPIKIILNKFDANSIQATVEQQIQEYFGFDQSQLQQLRQKNNNREIKIILIIDLPYDIQMDQFPILFKLIESQYWHECKILLSINQQMINSLKLYNKNYKLPVITFYIEQFSQSQLDNYLQKNLENQVRKKVSIILEQFSVIFQNSNSANIIINEITNILLQEVYQKENVVKKSQKLKKQLKQLSQQSNLKYHLNDVIETFEHELKEIWSVQTYQSLLLKYQFNHIRSIPLTLKLIVETLPKIYSINSPTKQFDFFEKLFLIILQIENFQQGNLKQIYLFAIQIIETEVFQRDETVKSNYEIIYLLPNNPFKNTKYLNYLWLSKTFVDFFVAYYIHEEVIEIKNKEMEIEVAQQQNLELQVDDIFFFNKFDSQNLHIYKKIQFECDFDKVILNSQNYYGVLNFLKEKCWLDKVKVDKLLNIIKASSIIENFEQEAGNAFTILKELKEFYLREDFSKIKLKNFSLDRSQFFQCNFSYSKMDNFTIYNCYFVGCSLDFVEWQNMRNLLISEQNNRDYINFSPDNKYVASSYTLDNYGHPKFHIEKEENSEVVLSFSHDSRHFISKRVNNDQSDLISCIFIKGNRQFNRKKCENFLDADYFSNDLIIVATYNYFKYYSIKNLKLLRKLKTDEGIICLSGDHSIQAIVNEDLIEFYNTKTINQIYSLNGKSPCVFAPNNSFIFAFCGDDKINVIDIQKQQILWTFKEEIDNPLAISKELILAYRCESNELYFLDLKKGGEFLTRQDINHCYDDFKFFNNGNTLGISGKSFGSSDYNFLLDFNAVKSNYNPPFCEFNEIALSDKIFVACEQRKVIFFWDLQFGKILDQIPYEYEIVCLQLSYNSNILAIGRLNKFVELWDVQTRKKIHNYANLQNEIKQVIFSYDDQLLAITCCDNRVYFYNIKTSRQEQILKFETVLNSIAFSPDSQSFLIGGSNGQVIQTNLQSMKRKVIYQQQQQIQLVIYTAQVHQMIFSTENEIILWDIQKNNILDRWNSDKNFKVQAFNKNFIICFSKVNMKEKYILQFNQNKINDISSNKFSDFGYQIALSPNTNILIIAKTYECLQIIYLNYFNTFNQKQKMIQSIQNQDFNYNYKMPIAICENQNFIASGTEIGHIDLWSARNGQLLLKLAVHTQSVQCLDFHPIHPILASGSLDQTIILWNIENGVLIKKLEGHNKGVISIAFSEDGQFIASGGQDFKVIIWKFENHQIYWEFNGYQSEIVSVSFSPNGKIFAFAEFNGQIHLWDTQNEKILSSKYFEQKLLWAKFKTNDEFLILTKEKIILWELKSKRIKIQKLKTPNLNVTALYFQKIEKLIIYGQKYLKTYDLISKNFIGYSSDLKYTIINFLSYQSKENQIQQFKDFYLHQSMYALKDNNNTVIISDIKLKDLTLQIKNYKSFPIASCLSNDQNILALSNWDKLLQLWDLQKDSQICSITNLDIQINHLKFSQKGDLIACRTVGQIIILLDQNLKEVNRLELPDICNSDFFISPDSQFIVCVIQKGLFIWQVDQSNFILNISSNDGINWQGNKLDYFDFSEDSQYIIFYFQNHGYIFIWDIRSQNCCCKISMEYMSCFSLPIENKLKQFESVSTRQCKIYANLGDFVINKSLILENVLENDYF